MNIDILTKSQAEQLIKEEMRKVREILFKELNNMRSKILKLEEENKSLKILLK